MTQAQTAFFTAANLGFKDTNKKALNEVIRGVKEKIDANFAAGIVAEAATATGTTYSLSSDNNNRLALFTAASGTTVTIPSGLPSGFSCLLVQTTTSGQVTVSGGNGVTLRSALSSTKTAYQWAVASVIYIGTEEYLLTGEVTA